MASMRHITRPLLQVEHPSVDAAAAATPAAAAAPAAAPLAVPISAIVDTAAVSAHVTVVVCKSDGIVECE